MKDCFDEVWVINLKRRPDRLARFFDNIHSIEWPFKHPKVFYAIDGDKVGVPRYWQTGGGSYGCHRSHILLLERAINNGVQSILILEDDATFMQDFPKRIEQFLKIVPKDWECLMIGGQHANSTPIPITRGVARAGAGAGIQRTHCYALRGITTMKDLYRSWADSAVHCDWVMGPHLARKNTYAPDPFLVGQAFGSSDISGGVNPTKFWKAPTGREPVIILRAPRSVMEDLQQRGWHGGFNRDTVTGIDLGLVGIFGNARITPTERPHKLRQWIEMIQWEVVSMENSIACIWHPEVTVDRVKTLVRGEVVEINVGSVEEALSTLSEKIQAVETMKTPVIILKSSKEIMESLREHGFHSGYWRDEVTGEDLGVKEALLKSRDVNELSCNIIRIARVLDEETIRIENGIVTFWNPEIQKDLFPSDEFHVLEISASTEEEALIQRKKWEVEFRPKKCAG